MLPAEAGTIFIDGASAKALVDNTEITIAEVMSLDSMSFFVGVL
jgi:hypothetical protein